MSIFGKDPIVAPLFSLEADDAADIVSFEGHRLRLWSVCCVTRAGQEPMRYFYSRTSAEKYSKSYVGKTIIIKEVIVLILNNRLYVVEPFSLPGEGISEVSNRVNTGEGSKFDRDLVASIVKF